MPDALPKTNTITGRDAFLRVLADEGVVKMFGNPGTTELPIMHALSSAPEMGYVLALPLIMFAASGIYHLIQSAMVPPQSNLAMGRPVNVASGKWPIEADWALIANDRLSP